MTNFSTLLGLGWLALSAGAGHAQAVYFAPAVTYSAGELVRPADLAVGDINGDGHPDLVAANNYSNRASLLMGNGDGTFQTASFFGFLNSPSYLALGDVNGDGTLDLVVQCYPGVGVAIGTGKGAFLEPVYYNANSGPYSPAGLALADVNSDGKPDILVNYSGLDEVRLFLNQGTGTFKPAALVLTTGGNAHPSATDFYATDVNGDGKPDLVLGSPYYFQEIRVVLGKGDGTFQPYRNSTTNCGFPLHFAVADLDGDGRPDVFSSSYVSSTAGWMKGNGNGSFQWATPISFGSDVFRALAKGDVNLDGKVDVLDINYVGELRVRLGNGNGTLQGPTAYSLGATMSGPYHLTAADVNHDGRPDLLATAEGSSRVGVLLNSATPLPTRAALPGASASLAPNPTEGGAATLTLAGLPAAVAQVQATLLDATGRTVARQQLPAAQGAARAGVPTASLPAGLYVLRLTAFDAQGAAVGELPAQRLSVR